MASRSYAFDNHAAPANVILVSCVASSVDDVERLLHEWSRVEEPVAGDIPAVLVAHGIACADILRVRHAADLALQIAGLLHDVGLLLHPGDEVGHPVHGAQYVRSVFGDRAARLIALHVDAQRYLERTATGYKVEPPPTMGFAEQPAPMSAAEARAFEADPLFEAALELRRADDDASGEATRSDASAFERPFELMRRFIRDREGHLLNDRTDGPAG